MPRRPLQVWAWKLFPLLLLASPIDSLACSMMPGWVPPTNFELVARAEVIVVARAVSSAPKYRVAFEVEETITGVLPASSLTLPGRIHPTTPPTSDLWTLKPDLGPCQSADFEIGKRYALLLETHPRADPPELLYVGSAFARVNEEVGEGSLWLELVREYARIAGAKSATPKERSDAITELKEKWGADPGRAELLEDLQHHLDTPTPWKSFAEIRSIFERTADTRVRARALWSLAAASPTREAAELAASVLHNDTPERLRAPALRILAAAKDRRGFDFAAKSLFDEKSSRESYWWRNTHLYAVLGLATESDADRAIVLRAWETREDGDAGWIASWIGDHPWPAGVAALREAVGKNYESAHHISFALAASGDADVVTWALAELRDEDPSWVAAYVIARSPLPAADLEAKRRIKKGGPSLTTLVQGYGQATHPNVIPRLKDAMGVRAEDPHLEFWLVRSLRGLAESGQPEASSLLEQLPKNPQQPPPEHH